MQRATAHSDVFRAIADPTRRAILDRLRSGPVAVNSLASAFQQSRPAISKHLKVLRDCNVVAEEKHGRERLYRLQPDTLRPVANWIEDYRAFWHSGLERLKSYVEESQ
jgi:DNA-binding transcriptional ArsR family regulator